jgi:hypothetical protein
MQIDLDHPTLTHLFGYLTEEKWADAIRGKNVDSNIAWELLRIQDNRYHGSMFDAVKEIVELSDEDYKKYYKSKV